MAVVPQLQSLAAWLQTWLRQRLVDASFASQSRLCNRCRQSFLTEVIPDFIQRSEMSASGSQTEHRFPSSVEFPYATIEALKISVRKKCTICCLLLWTISKCSYSSFDKFDNKSSILLSSSPGGIRIIVEGLSPAKLYIYVSETDTAALYGILRPNPTSWDSEESYRIIGRWIQTCKRSHVACQRQRQPIMPTRILDVGELEDNIVKLHIPRSSDRQGEYLALSYCWGSSPSTKLTSTNLVKHKRGIRMSTIPRTIRDAVIITRKLGFKYLWVDSLCIIQDCARDWQLESSKMADVYGTAFLTICACASADCHNGIFRQIPLSARTTCRVPCVSQAGRRQLLLGPGYAPTPFSKEPINHRGWTLQERLLSWRVVLYGKDALGWQCQTVSFGTGPKGDDFSYEDYQWRPELDATYDSHNWRRIAEEYSRRQLSNFTDKFPALAGIARMFHSRLDTVYLAGMWRNTLLEDLLWYYVVGSRNELDHWKLSSYVAPSWSWLSANEPISFRIAQAEQYQWRAKVSRCNAELGGPDPFGQVTSGRLLLHGPIKAAYWDTYWETHHGIWEGMHRHILTKESSEWPTGSPPYKRDDMSLGLICADITTREKYPFFERGQHTDKVWCLLLQEDQEDHLAGYYRGLVLTPIASFDVQHYGVENPGHTQFYRRIGIFTIERSSLWFSDANVEFMEII